MERLWDDCWLRDGFSLNGGLPGRYCFVSVNSFQVLLHLPVTFFGGPEHSETAFVPSRKVLLLEGNVLAVFFVKGSANCGQRWPQVFHDMPTLPPQSATGSAVECASPDRA